MATIEERIVKMRFDNSQFAQKARETLDSLQKLEEKLKFKGSKDAFKGITIASSQVDFSNIENGVGKIETKLSALGVLGQTVMQKIASGVVDLGQKLVHKLMAPLNQIWEGGKTRAMNIEQARFKLEGLGITGDKLNVVWQNVTDAVDGTAYSLDAAAITASQLAASGIQGGQQMETSLKAISGLAAVTGSSYEDIGRIFSQVAGQGRLMGNDLLQLSTKGMNAAADLAKAFGKTEAEVRDMVSKGQVDFDTFAQVMFDRYSKAAFKANETLTGVMANTRSALAKIGADLITPFITNTGTEGHVSNLVELMNRVRESINLVRNALGPLFSVMQKYGLGAIQGLTSFLEKFNKLTDPTVQKVEKLTKTTKKVGDSGEEAAKKIEGLAQAVIKGDWGNGEERMKRLAEAGHDYAEVQNVVNEMMDGSYDRANHMKEAVEEVTVATEIATAKNIDFRESLAKGFGNIIEIVAKPLAAVAEAIKKAFKIEDLVQFLNIISYAFEKITAKFVISDKMAKSITDTLTILFTGVRLAIKACLPIFDIALKGINAILWVIKQLIEIPIILITTPFRAICRIADLFTANQSFQKGIENVATAFNNFKNAIRNVVGGIKDFIGAFLRILGLPFKFIGDSFLKLRDLFESGFVNGISAIIKFFADGILAVSEVILDFVTGTTKKFKEWGEGIGNTFKALYEKGIKPVVDWFDNLYKTLTEGVGNTTKNVTDWAQKTKDAFVQWVQKGVEPLTNKLKALKGWMDKTWNGGIKSVKNWYKNSLPKIVRWTKETGKSILSWTKSTGHALKNWAMAGIAVVALFVNKALEAFGHFYSVFKEKFSAVLEKAKPILDQFGTKAVEVFNKVKEALKGIFNSSKKINIGKLLAAFVNFDPKTFIVDKLDALVTRIQHFDFGKIFKDLFHSMDKGLTAAYEFFFGKTDTSVFQKIGKMFQDLEDFLKNSFTPGVVSNFENGVTTVSTQLDKLKETASNFLSGISYDKIKKVIWDICDVMLRLSTIRTTNNLGNFLDGLGKGLKNFAGMDIEADTIVGKLNIEHKKTGLENFIEFVQGLADAVLKITGSITILSLLDPNAVNNSLTALGEVGAGLAAFGLLFTKNKISSKLVGGVDGLEQFSESVDSMCNGLLKLAGSLAIIGILLNGGQIIKSLFTIGVTLGILGTAMKLMKKHVSDLPDVSKNFEGLANGLLKLTTPIAVFSFIPMQKLAQGVIAVGVAMWMLQKAVVSISKNAGEGLSESAESIKAVGDALIRLAVPVAVFSLLDLGKLAQGIIATGAAMWILQKGLVALSKNAGDNLENCGKAIKEVSIALDLLLIPILILGHMNLANLAVGMVAVGVSLAGLCWAVSSLSNNSPSAKAAGIALLAIAGAVGILGVTMKLLENVSWGAVAKGLLTFIVAVGGLALVGHIAQAAAGGLLALGGAALAIGASIALGAAAIWLIVDALQKVASMTPDACRQIVQNIDAFGQELAKSAGSIAKNFVQALTAGIVGALQGALSGICQGIGNLFSDIGNFFNEQMSGFNKWCQDAARNMGYDIPEAMGDAASNSTAVQEGVNKAAEKVDTTDVAGKNGEEYIDKYGNKVAQGDIGDAVEQLATDEEGAAKAGDINTESVVNSMAEKFREMGLPEDTIASLCDSLDFDSLGLDMSNGMMGGFLSNINGEGGLASIAGGIDFSSFTSVFQTNGSGIMDAFGKAMGDNSQAVVDGAQQAIDKVPEVLSSKDEMLNGIAIATMTNYGEGLVSGFNDNVTPRIDDVFDYIQQAFDQHAPELNQKGIDCTLEFGTGFQTGYESNIAPAINNLTSQIAISFENVYQVFEESGFHSGVNYSLGLGRASSELETTGSNMATSVINGFLLIDNMFETTGHNSGLSIGRGIQNGISEMQPNIQSSVESIINVLAGLVSKFGEVGKNAGLEYTSTLNLNIASGMAQVRSTMLDTMNKLIAEILATIRASDRKYSDAATSNMRAYNQAMSAFSSQLNATGSSIVSGIAGKFNRYSDFYNAGASCMTGFRNGMNSQAGSVWTTAYNLGRRALEAAKKAVDSHSPSKEFFKLGVYNDQGLILGLKSKSKEVEKVSANVSKKSLDAMTETFKGIDLTGLDDNLAPTIRPVVDLTGVDEAKDKIQGMLSVDPESAYNISKIFGDKPKANQINNFEVSVNNKDVISSLGELRTELSDLKTSMKNLKVYMDSGRLIGEIIDGVDTRLGVKQTLKARGV